MIDADKLISLVFRHPGIWDKRLKFHKNRAHVEKCWSEISEVMKIEDHILKKKWKYLRDQYATELTKEARLKSEAGATGTATSKWPYFKALAFLKPIVKPRQSSGKSTSVMYLEAKEEPLPFQVSLEENDEDPLSENSNDPSGRNDADEFIKELGLSSNTKAGFPSSIEDETETSNPRQIFNCTGKRKRCDDFESAMLEIEKKKLELLSYKSISKRETEEEDEHLMFFKTLLPHVKKIRTENIFPFRSRIQDVVQEFAYPMKNRNETQMNSGQVSRNATPLPCTTTSSSLRSTTVKAEEDGIEEIDE